MRTTLMTSALVASAIFGSVALTTSASAMPVAPLQANQSATVEQARWVCGWHGRCFWRPNFRAYNFYGPRFYGPRFHRGPWGWRHRFWGHPGWRRF